MATDTVRTMPAAEELRERFRDCNIDELMNFLTLQILRHRPTDVAGAIPEYLTEYRFVTSDAFSSLQILELELSSNARAKRIEDSFDSRDRATSPSALSSSGRKSSTFPTQRDRMTECRATLTSVEEKIVSIQRAVTEDIASGNEKTASQLLSNCALYGKVKRLINTESTLLSVCDLSLDLRDAVEEANSSCASWAAVDYAPLISKARTLQEFLVQRVFADCFDDDGGEQEHGESIITRTSIVQNIANQSACLNRALPCASFLASKRNQPSNTQCKTTMEMWRSLLSVPISPYDHKVVAGIQSKKPMDRRLLEMVELVHENPSGGRELVEHGMASEEKRLRDEAEALELALAAERKAEEEANRRSEKRKQDRASSKR